DLLVVVLLALLVRAPFGGERAARQAGRRRQRFLQLLARRQQRIGGLRLRGRERGQQEQRESGRRTHDRVSVGSLARSGHFSPSQPLAVSSSAGASPWPWFLKSTLKYITDSFFPGLRSCSPFLTFGAALPSPLASALPAFFSSSSSASSLPPPSAPT